MGGPKGGENKCVKKKFEDIMRGEDSIGGTKHI